MTQADITIDGKDCLIQRHERQGINHTTVFLKKHKRDGGGLVLLATDENEPRAIRAARRKILMGAMP
jgi:hypothetical protein